jgi:hypothetical protein
MNKLLPASRLVSDARLQKPTDSYIGHLSVGHAQYSSVLEPITRDQGFFIENNGAKRDWEIGQGAFNCKFQKVTW